MRWSVSWLSVLLGLGCVDSIAPIGDFATPCTADSDCENSLFCDRGRCLRTSRPRCGDGVLASDEQCDDGNRSDADDCVNCRTARCGDGVLRIGVEACDEGDDANSDEQPDRCRRDCRLPHCGDGVQDREEACDDGQDNARGVPDRCRLDCTLPRCGDGIVDQNEACDDGNTDDRDDCLPSCQIARCGDGVIRSDRIEGEPGFEYCDDGNADDSDDCDQYCGRGILAVANQLESTCALQNHGVAWCWGKITQVSGAGLSLRPERVHASGRLIDIKPIRLGFIGLNDRNELFSWSETPVLNNRPGAGLQASQIHIDTGRIVDMMPFYEDFYLCQSNGDILRINRNVWNAPEVIDGPDIELKSCAIYGTSPWALENPTYCVVSVDGEAYCWGDNSHFQVGDGTQVDRQNPYRLPLSNVVDLAFQNEEDHLRTCALDANDDLWCWGRVPDGIIAQPTRIDGIPSLGAINPAWRRDTGAWVSSLQITEEADGTLEEHPTIQRPRLYSNSYSTACVIDGQHKLWCSGDDRYGTSGYGRRWRYLPVEVEALDAASSLALGRGLACAQRRAGEDMYCWGGSADRRYTALARGTGSGIRNGDPPSWVGEALAMDVGLNHSCAIRPSGTIACWGVRFQGPGQVNLPNERPAQQLSIGASHQCALADGLVYCWGANEHGQTGAAPDHDPAVPHAINNLPSATLVSVGNQHSCALDDNGRLWCWGDNGYGQLGRTGVSTSLTPLEVPLPAAAAQVSAGATHTCARTTENRVICWGGEGNPTGYEPLRNAQDEIIQPRNAEFRTVPGIEGAGWVSSGVNFACAVRSGTQDIMCWAGAPNLVTGRRIYEGVEPRVITGLPPMARVEAGDEFACGLSTTGSTWCWGLNQTNQLGDEYPGEGIPFSLTDRLEISFSEFE